MASKETEMGLPTEADVMEESQTMEDKAGPYRPKYSKRKFSAKSKKKLGKKKYKR